MFFLSLLEFSMNEISLPFWEAFCLRCFIAWNNNKYCLILYLFFLKMTALCNEIKIADSPVIIKTVIWWNNKERRAIQKAKNEIYSRINSLFLMSHSITSFALTVVFGQPSQSFVSSTKHLSYSQCWMALCNFSFLTLCSITYVLQFLHTLIHVLYLKVNVQ